MLILYSGQVVVRVVNGMRISGRIVETESYLGLPDKASHSYNGRRTARTGAMFMKAGTSYVYTIYGMYYCFNISSQGTVLILLETLRDKK